MQSKFKIGDLIQSKYNPSIFGIIQYLTESYAVVIVNGLQKRLNLNQIEIKEIIENPFELFKKMKFSNLIDLKNVLLFCKLDGKLRDHIYSMDLSKIDFHSFQFLPVLKILKSPSDSILIADEVGLGKTIEALLIWTELRIRYNFNKLVVLCPAHLKVKWKNELQNKFNIKAEICNANSFYEKINEVINEKQNISLTLIVGIESIRPKDFNLEKFEKDEIIEYKNRKDKFAEILAKQSKISNSLIDLLIIDESHILRNSSTKNNLIATLLSKNSLYKLLLSATPIQTKSENLYHQLKIIDENLFRNFNDFEQILSQNKPLIKFRDKLLSNSIISEDEINSLLIDLSDMRFTNSFFKEILDKFTKDIPETYKIDNVIDYEAYFKDNSNRVKYANFFERINFLGKILNRTRHRDVQLAQPIRVPRLLTATFSLKEKEYYESITNYVKSKSAKTNTHFLHIMPQRIMASSIPASYEYYKYKYHVSEEEIVDYLDSNLIDLEYQDETLSNDDSKSLLQIINKFNYQDLEGNDSKFNILLKFINSDEINKIVISNKMIIFTTFRSTVNYLYNRLKKADNITCYKLLGGMNQDEFNGIIEMFQKESRFSILVSTDVASEGVDLQFCDTIINYDLPWNPMKIEQRIGRIDRIGQICKKVNIINIIFSNSIDMIIYVRLLERIKIFTEILGITEEILGDEISKLSYEVFQLTEKEIQNKIDMIALAIENEKINEKQLENDEIKLLLKNETGLKTIHKIREKSRVISDNDLINYFKVFFSNYEAFDQKKIGATNEYTYEIVIPKEINAEIREYILKNKTVNTNFVNPGSVRSYFNVKSEKIAGFETIDPFHPIIHYISEKRKKADKIVFPSISCELSFEFINSETKFQNFKKGDYFYGISLFISKIDNQEAEELFYFLVDVDLNNRNYFNTDISEDLIVKMINYGKPLNFIDEETNFAFKKLEEEILNYKDDKFNIFKDELDQEYKSKIYFQINSLNSSIQYLENQRDSIIDLLKTKNEISMIKPTEVRYKNKIDLLEIKRFELEKKVNEIHFDCTDLSFGYLKIK